MHFFFPTLMWSVIFIFGKTLPRGLVFFCPIDSADCFTAVKKLNYADIGAYLTYLCASVCKVQLVLSASMRRNPLFLHLMMHFYTVKAR